MTDKATYPVYTRTPEGDYRSAAGWSITLVSLAGIESCVLRDLDGFVFGRIVGGETAGTLTIYEDFVWNGTDVVPDTFRNLPGSKVHDALRRARRAARLRGEAFAVSWDQCDAAYLETLKMFGDSVLRRLVKWRAVNGVFGRVYAWLTERFGRKPAVSAAHQAAENLGRAMREDAAGERWGELTNQGDSNYCWAHAAYNALEALHLAQGWSPERIRHLAESEVMIRVRADGALTRGALVMLVQSLPGVWAVGMPHWDTAAVRKHLRQGWRYVAVAMEGAAARDPRRSVHAAVTEGGAVFQDNGHATVLLDARTAGWWIFKRVEFLREDSYGLEPEWYPDWYFKRRNSGVILVARKEAV